MKTMVTGLVTAGALSLYALPANADLVQGFVELKNSTAQAMTVSVSLGGGKFAPAANPFQTGCKSGTLDAASQTVTLASGECGQWETVSTGGTSGTSGSITFALGEAGAAGGDPASIAWDYPWACGPDNLGNLCNPSASAQIGTPVGNVFNACGPEDFVINLVNGFAGERNGIDTSAWLFEAKLADGKTCTPLVSPPPPPPPPPAPGCTLPPQTSCGSEYVPAGYNGPGPAYYNSVSTLPITCPGGGSPSVLAEVVDGAALPFPLFCPNLSYSATTADLYVLGGQYGGYATWGEQVGTTHSVAACNVSAGGTSCDTPTPVTITNCCTPRTCDASNCGGVQSDGCGGTINCGTTCPSGQTCNSTGTCVVPVHCGTPIACCVAAGGDWIRGKCEMN